MSTPFENTTEDHSSTGLIDILARPRPKISIQPSTDPTALRSLRKKAPGDSAATYWNHWEWTFPDHKQVWREIYCLQHKTAHKPTRLNRYTLAEFLYFTSLSENGRSHLEALLPEVLVKPLPRKLEFCIDPALLPSEVPVSLHELSGPFSLQEFARISNLSMFIAFAIRGLRSRRPERLSLADLKLRMQSLVRVEEYRLLSYNIFGLPGYAGGKHPKRYEGISEELRQRKASLDILGLQEMWDPQTAVIANQSGYPYRACSDRMHGLVNANGLLTLSRHPIEMSKTLVFSLARGIERFARKGVLFTRIRISRDRRIDVYNTHMASTTRFLCHRDAEEIRAKQLTELKSWIERYRQPNIPIIVLGDMNTDESSPNYSIMRKLFGYDLYRTRVKPSDVTCSDSVRFSDSRSGWTFNPHTNPLASSPNLNPQRLDYIFANSFLDQRLGIGSSLLFGEDRFRGVPLSDHSAVMATIQEFR